MENERNHREVFSYIYGGQYASYFERSESEHFYRDLLHSSQAANKSDGFCYGRNSNVPKPT